MSLNLENQKCVVCQAYLFPEDDLVYCPQCGAPHHRDCYNSLGKCGMEEFHGTAKEYKKPEIPTQPEPKREVSAKADICLRCGKPKVDNARFCPYCGAPGTDEFKNIPFGNFTIVDGKAPIDEGIVTEDVAKVVMLNPLRYIEKFKKLKGGKKLSFNWAAFLVPHGWFAYRKMYKASIVTSAFKIIANLLAIPFLMNIQAIFGSEIPRYAELLSYFANNPTELQPMAIALGFAGSILTFIIHIISGVFADCLYKDKVFSSVKKIKASSDPEQLLRKLGGINTIGFLLAVLAVEFLPELISIFLV